MKQKIYILGIITILVIFMGTLFKINHWPAAGIMLTIGLATLVLVFLPLAIADHYKASGRKYPGLHFITWLTCFVVFTSMLFKLMHWPYAGIALMIAIPFPYLVFLPVFIISTSRDKNFNINNLVAVLILLTVNSVFSGLLALNVSRERIVDSYSLARSYMIVESVVSGLPSDRVDSQIVQKIDNAVKIITDYQEIILKAEGNYPGGWLENPDILHPSARGVASESLIEAGEKEYGNKLATALAGITDEFGKIPEYRLLAVKMPEITGLNTGSGDYTAWAEATFKDSACSWVLTYLQGLKSDLLTIKASLL